MMILRYPTKKELKNSIGKELQYQETSWFGNEYVSTGTFVGSNRPSLTGYGKREIFASLTMKDDLIVMVR